MPGPKNETPSPPEKPRVEVSPEQLFNETSSYILALDPNLKIIAANDTIKSATYFAPGFDPDTSLHSLLQVFSPQIIDEIKSSVSILTQDKTNDDFTAKSNGQTIKWTTKAVFNDNQIDHYTLTGENITEVFTNETTIDPITKFYGRAVYEAEKTMENNHRPPREGEATIEKILFILDIDWLKKINDEWGHIVGDEAIADVAEIIRQTFRNEDPKFRIGGDEMVVVAEDMMATQTQLIYERLKENTEIINEKRNKDHLPPVSISAAHCLIDPYDANGRFDHAFNKADHELFVKKKIRHSELEKQLKEKNTADYQI